MEQCVKLFVLTLPANGNSRDAVAVTAGQVIPKAAVLTFDPNRTFTGTTTFTLSLQTMQEQ
jgi:hypothetical protein